MGRARTGGGWRPATTLADGVTVQLSTCDPGTGAERRPAPPDVGTALVARQIARARHPPDGYSFSRGSC